MRILLLSVLAVIACTGLWGCSNDEASQILFPNMSSGSTTLRVVRATNPRLPQLSPEQFHALLIETEKVVKRPFGVDLQFETAIQVSVSELFGTFPTHVIDVAKRDICNFKTINDDQPRLIKHMGSRLRENGSTMNELVAFAGPHINPGYKITTYRTFTKARVDTLLRRLEVEANQRARQNTHHRRQPYNE